MELYHFRMVYYFSMEKKPPKTVGIILAAGKGKRLNSHDANKVSLPFAGRPLIVYAAELMQQVASQTVCVVGAWEESVRHSLANFSKIKYVKQTKQLGTAHAVSAAVGVLDETFDLALVGYGDHMMFYNSETINKLIKLHRSKKAVMSLISVQYEKPNELSWGRIIRDQNDKVVDSREQKDASEKEKQITELNAGFYCFDYIFLKQNLKKVPRSPISGEYYINNLVKIASKQNQNVAALKVPFWEVGIGINHKEEFALSEALYHQKNKLR
jgi:bifunctional UDP-N-acetylglucosamine pyrophosphorylase / glucosamine-1-phosphate N-acetyltransferase